MPKLSVAEYLGQFRVTTDVPLTTRLSVDDVSLR